MIMKKMNYGSFSCKFSIGEDCALLTQVSCDYGKSTVAYAVERFFAQSKILCRECTYKSWQVRVAKGRARKKHNFMYIVPALFLELPGNWIRICGHIDAAGVTVKRVEILKDHPCFYEHKNEKGRE